MGAVAVAFSHLRAIISKFCIMETDIPPDKAEKTRGNGSANAPGDGSPNNMKSPTNATGLLEKTVQRMKEANPVTPTGKGQEKDYRKLYHTAQNAVLKLRKDKMNQNAAELEQLKKTNEKLFADNKEFKERAALYESEKQGLNDIISSLQEQNNHFLAENNRLKAYKRAEERLGQSVEGQNQVENLKFDYSRSSNVDEDKRDGRTANLNPIMNNCTVYLSCRNCVGAAQDLGVEIGKTIPPGQINARENGVDRNTDPNLISSFKEVLDDKVSKIETKLETIIERKLNERSPRTDAVKKNGRRRRRGEEEEVALVQEEEIIGGEAGEGGWGTCIVL